MHTSSSGKCSVSCTWFTYIRVLNEEVLAGSVPLHRQHITVLFLTLPHQEVSIVLQQLLDLQSGDGSVVPVLLSQRTVHVLHKGVDLDDLEEKKTGTLVQLTGITKQSKTEFRDSAEIRWEHFKGAMNHSTVPPSFVPPGQQSDESLEEEEAHTKNMLFIAQTY